MRHVACRRNNTCQTCSESRWMESQRRNAPHKRTSNPTKNDRAGHDASQWAGNQKEAIQGGERSTSKEQSSAMQFRLGTECCGQFGHLHCDGCQHRQRSSRSIRNSATVVRCHGEVYTARDTDHTFSVIRNMFEHSTEEGQTRDSFEMQQCPPCQ